MTTPTTNVPGPTGLMPNQPTDRVAPNTGDEGKLGANLKITSTGSSSPPPLPKRVDVASPPPQPVTSRGDGSGSSDGLKGFSAHQRKETLDSATRLDSFRSDESVELRSSLVTGRPLPMMERHAFVVAENRQRRFEAAASGDTTGRLPVVEQDAPPRLTEADIPRLEAELAELEDEHAEKKGVLDDAYRRITENLSQLYEYKVANGENKYTEKSEPIKSFSDLIKRVGSSITSGAKSLASAAWSTLTRAEKAPEPVKPPAFAKMDDGTNLTLEYVAELEAPVEELQNRIADLRSVIDQLKPSEPEPLDIFKELANAPYLHDLPVEQQEQFWAEYDAEQRVMVNKWVAEGRMTPEEAAIYLDLDTNVEAVPGVPTRTQNDEVRPLPPLPSDD